MTPFLDYVLMKGRREGEKERRNEDRKKKEGRKEGRKGKGKEGVRQISI